VQTATVRADSLLSILLLLQTNGRLTARALAARLEVSERTIDRDMEALSIAGVPVWAQRGRRGGWQLSDAYRTDLSGLTEPELRGLVLATAPGVIGDLGLGEAIERALVKILAELPEGRRRDAEATRGYLHVDQAGWRRTEDAAPQLIRPRGCAPAPMRTRDAVRARNRRLGRRVSRRSTRPRGEGKRLVLRRGRER
jgi:predicted DNA-binding transcriptional regulator YafY